MPRSLLAAVVLIATLTPTAGAREGAAPEALDSAELAAFFDPLLAAEMEEHRVPGGPLLGGLLLEPAGLSVLIVAASPAAGPFTNEVLDRLTERLC